MASSFGWGFLAAFSLVIGAVIALVFHLSLRVIGLIMAFGAGVLISAVAFDLVQEAADKSSGHGALIAGLFSGCLVFAGGDWLIGRFGGRTARTRLAISRTAPRLPSCWDPCWTGSRSPWSSA